MSMAKHRLGQDHSWTNRQLVTAMGTTTSPSVNENATTFILKNERRRKRHPCCEEPYGSYLAFRQKTYCVPVTFCALLSCAFGCLCGVLLTLFIQQQHFQVQGPHRVHDTTIQKVSLFNPSTVPILPRSTFELLQDIPYVESHSHAGIRKQALLIGPVAAAVHPDLVGISVATIQPGQMVTMHAHESMHEFFYIYQGEVEITVVSYPPNMDANISIRHSYHNHTTTTDCEKNECFFHAASGEAHSFAVRRDAPVATKMLIVQLAVHTSSDA
jgi:mannose-6-phosphate isomerase-like protein (cupin superfamily)